MNVMECDTKNAKNIGVFESKGTPRYPRFVFAGSLAALFVFKDFLRRDTTDEF